MKLLVFSRILTSTDSNVQLLEYLLRSSLEGIHQLEHLITYPDHPICSLLYTTKS